MASRGALERDDRGLALPWRFGPDVEGEYAALRDGAALVDLGFRTLVRVTGEDRAAFLQGMLTNDVAALAPGRGCPALLLTIQGRVTADLRVVALPDSLLLDVDVRAADGLLEALEKLLIADDVELARLPDVTLIGVEGPRAASLVPGSTHLASFAHLETSLGGGPVRVMRVSEVRGPGLVLHVPCARAARVWDHLVQAGATPCGMEALERRRIEVGVPRIGLDMDLATLALEVPVEDAISSTKGCYLGQEVIARGTARGHVNRRMVGVELAGEVPERGAGLTSDGKEVGRVTSVAGPLGARGPVALGLVRREHWAPGTELAAGALTRARIKDFPLS
ncbi:MAG TPA: glycine cleavage T C-terminal barrel domain-containing protein [Candidatus Nitrosopolaris sp.]|nr:glycine cleavage T C-terminal barrel domain-containing protein [Candidatus Nitrosopolaris sp.]